MMARMDRLLSTLSTQVEDLHARQAFIVKAAVNYFLGSGARSDPKLLGQFLAGRGLSGPVKLMVKAAVTAMDTTSALAAARPMLQAFIGAVDRRSVLGKLQAVRVPVSNAIGAVQTMQATAYSVGESKPLSALGFVSAPAGPAQSGRGRRRRQRTHSPRQRGHASAPRKQNRERRGEGSR
jgi:hypothetical protein